MTHLRLSFLGPPEVLYAGQALTFPTRKALALLVYLAVEGGIHPREKLLALFWPDSNPGRGRGTLRTTLAYLRRALNTVAPSSDEYLIIESDMLGFNFTSDFALDLHIVAETGKSSQIPQLEAAAQAYRGDFLEGFSLPDAPAFDEWASFQREKWHHQMNRILDWLSQQQSEARRYEAGLATAARWIAHDPVNEAAHRRLMQLYAISGHRTAALQAYAACQMILETELGLEPSAETRALAERIRADELTSQLHNKVTKDQSATAPLPFVGRSSEHSQLAAAYQTIRERQAQVVVIQGEAGIGKTRLVEEFLSWLRIQGVDILQGRAFEAGGRLSYQPLVDALRARVEQVNAPDDLLNDTWLAELSRLLPELRDRYPDLPLPLSATSTDEAEAHAHLLEAIARLGQALAERQPVVFLIDDAQWADAASLDALHYCGRGWANRRLPLLLLLVLRSEALTTDLELAGWLNNLARDIPVTRLELGALTAEETQQLVEKLLESKLAGEENIFSAPSSLHAPSFAGWLFRETAGQPFFISETLKALKDQAAQVTNNQTFADEALQNIVAPGVRHLILTRLSRLSKTAKALLTAVAIMGRPCSFERLCQVSGFSEDEALSGLDMLLDHQLLLEMTDPIRPYTFSHDKIRDVVYTEAGDARRRLYHRRAFQALEGTASPAELAHHALAAHLKAPTFRYSLAAGDAAMQLFAVRDAITHYENARTSGVEHATPEQWQHVYTHLGRAYEIIGGFEQAQTICQEMLALAQKTGQTEMESTALNRLASLATYTHQLETAAAWLHQALNVAKKSGNKRWLAETEWSLAQLTQTMNDMPASKKHSERALSLARDLDDPELIAGSQNTLAYATLLLGDAATGAALFEDSRARHATLGNRALEADCLTGICASYIFQGRVKAGIAAAQAALAICHEIENPWGRVFSGTWLAVGLLDDGQYEAALEMALTAKKQATVLGTTPVTIYNRIVLGNVYRALMDLARAYTIHLEAATLHESSIRTTFTELITAELCADCVLREDWETAYHYAQETLSHRQYNALPMVITPRWPETAALLWGGDGELAREDTQRSNELLGRLPRFRMLLLRSLALLAEREGDRKKSIAHLQESNRLAEEMGLPGEQRQILIELTKLYQAEWSELFRPD